MAHTKGHKLSNAILSMKRILREQATTKQTNKQRKRRTQGTKYISPTKKMPY